MVIKGGIHAVIHVALGGYIGVRIPQKTFIDYIEQYCYKNRQENRGERQNERAHCARTAAGQWVAVGISTQYGKQPLMGPAATARLITRARSFPALTYTLGKSTFTDRNQEE